MNGMKNVQSIVDSGQCIGCAACYSICPNGYIMYKEDGGNGFPVPQVMKCEACGKCLSVCFISEMYDD